MTKKTGPYEKTDADKEGAEARRSSTLELGRFGERVRACVGEESLRSFARKARIDEKSLRKYMAGETVPSFEAAFGISEAAGVSLMWLATGTGSMRGSQEVMVAPLDRELLRLVIEEVEQLLVDVNGDLEPEKKAELIALIYEEVREQEGTVDRARVLRLIKLAS